MTPLNVIGWHRDSSGIVTLTIDDPNQSANTANEAFRRSLRQSVDRLKAEVGLTGVVITSGKSTFFAGGDLHDLLTITRDAAESLFIDAMEFKTSLRDLETLGVPVVAALNGSALGGGLEIALACHQRIALRQRRAEFGLPEVTLGLLPGGGGIVRTVRLLGLEAALDKVLLKGQRLSADEALAIGLIDEVVDSEDELLMKSRSWTQANPTAQQPWDIPGYNIAAAAGQSAEVALPLLAARLRRQTKGAPAQSAHHVLCAAVEGAAVDFNVAMRIETRYFIDLVTGQIAKNLIRARFLDLQTIKSGQSRPAVPEVWRPQKVAILGAGMMGAGIAYQCAISGLEVVLKDTTEEAALGGKARAAALLDRAVSDRKKTSEERDQVLARILPTARTQDCAGVDLVIEAVFESEELKHKVLKEIETIVGPHAVIGSNTSTIPITRLAAILGEPERMVGLHFFSPVDRMPLLEIIRGERTSDVTLAKAFDLALQIRKVPIVVNDSRGFFTSRVIGTVVNEAVAMLGEGINPASIERAATTIGFPVGMLQLTDELNMELSVSVFDEAHRARLAEGKQYVPHPAELVIQKMVDIGRAGRLRRAGFYDYSPEGKRLGLWSGTYSLFSQSSSTISFEDMQHRLLFIEALESVRCLEERVVTSATDANVGSVLGLGYPAWTGGVLEFINQYPGGLANFTRRADALSERYGYRFNPPPLLRQKASSGELFR